MGLLQQARASVGITAPQPSQGGLIQQARQAVSTQASQPQPQATQPAPQPTVLESAKNTVTNAFSSIYKTLTTPPKPLESKQATTIKIEPGQSRLTPEQFKQSGMIGIPASTPISSQEVLAPSTISQKTKGNAKVPEATIQDIAQGYMDKLFGVTPEERAKIKLGDQMVLAQNAYAVKTQYPEISSGYSLTDLLDKSQSPFTETPTQIVSKQVLDKIGISRQMDSKELTDVMMALSLPASFALGAEGLAPSVLKQLVALGKFTATSVTIDTALKAITGKDSFRELLPENTPGAIKDAVSIADFVGKAYISHGLKPGKLLDVFTKETLKKYNAPEKVYLSGDQIKNIFQDGKLTTAQQKQAFTELGLDGSQAKKLFSQKGVTIELPTENVTRIVDRPWWGKVKEIIGLSPTEVSKFEKTPARIVGNEPGAKVTMPDQKPIALIGDGKPVVVKANVTASEDIKPVADRSKLSPSSELYQPPAKAEVKPKTQEELASEYLSKRTNKFRQDTNVVEGGLRDTRETLVTKLQSMREGGASKVAITQVEKAISNIDKKIVEARTKYRVDPTAPVPEVGGKTPEQNLVVVHNIKPGGVINADKIGGLPVPSLAITNVNTPMTNFGDISLIADKSMVDPSNKSNKVFNADAYSPRYPGVENVPNDKAIDYLGSLLDKAKSILGDSMDGSKYTWIEYFKSDGESGMSNSFMSKQVFFAENNKVQPKDRAEVYDYVEKNQSKYDSFVSSIVDNIKGGERIFKGYTPSGNRKYVPHTIDNVVKIMSGKIRDGEGFNYGVGSLRASNAKQYTSLEKIKEDRVKIISGGEMEAIKNSLDRELNDILDYYGLPWDQTDAFLSITKDYMKGLISKTELDQYPTTKGKDMTKIVDFVKKLREAPTEYFEAKPQRAVSLSEFKHAVAPSDTPQNVLDIFKKNGVEVSTYNTDKERIAIIKQISEQKDLKFRLKDDFKKATGMEITDAQEKQIMDLNQEIFGDQDIKIMGQILTPDGQKALGSYRDGMISILGGKADAVDTFYHEAVHKYFDVFTTKEDQVKLLLFAQEKYGTQDFQATEEKLAEDFINYAKDKKGEGLDVKIRELFDKIIESIKKYFGSEDKIKKFYDDLLSGVAKQKEAKIQEYRNIAQNLPPVEKMAGIKDVKTSLSNIKTQIDQLTTTAKGIATLAQEQRAGLNTKDIAKLKRIYAKSTKFQEGDIQTIRASNTGTLLNNVIEDIQTKYPDLSEQEAFDFALNLPNKANESIKNTPQLRTLREQKKSLDNYMELLRTKETQLQGVASESTYNEWQSVLNAQEELAKIVEVPRYNLPVEGAGKERVSRLEARMKGVLKNASQDVIDQLGLSTFNQLNKDENIAKASEYVLNNPDEAMRVLSGEIPAPKGILNNAIFVAMERMSLGDVNLARKLASLASTRAGQEIGILSEIDSNSPVKAMSNVIKVREQAFAKKYAGRSVTEVKKDVVKKIKASIKPPTKDDWSSFIDSIEC